MLQTIENILMVVIGIGCLIIIFVFFPYVWRETHRTTRVCTRCGNTVKVEPGKHVMACYPVLTPYTKKDQTTKIEYYVHGVG